MSNSFTGKVVADGQLATTKGTLYTVPASTVFYGGSLTFFNTNAATQTIILYLKPGATSRKVSQVVLAQNESSIFDLRGLALPAGALIEAETTTATAVDYLVTGVEES